ncbi:MAG: hypothetical protein ACTSVZ_14270, partial [Promethearchaeota archaeon]
MPKTTNQRRYDHHIKSASEAYQKAVDTKSAKNTIKYSQQSLKKFEEAKDMASLVDMVDRIPYVNEYCVLSWALIGNAYFQEKSIEEAVDSFNKALELNQKTLNNQETLIRENYILTELLKIAKLQEDAILVGRFALKILANAQKLKDLKKQIKYYRIALDGVISAQNDPGRDKTWKLLIKAGKRAKTEELLPLQAEIWEDYGKFLLQQMKATSTSEPTSKGSTAKISKYFAK